MAERNTQMILSQPGITKKEIYLVLLHISIGIVASFFPLITPLMMIGLILVYIINYASNDKNKFYTILFITYITGMEVLYRASGITFLPYELSKYVQIGFILINILFARTWFNSLIGVLILILLLPSLILFPADLYKYFIFNSLGICSLGFLIAYTAYQKIDFDNYTKILKAFLYPCISFVTLITLKTPDFSKIEFGLGANFETTGGFGANQAATLLGAAVCFIIILLDKKIYLANRIITFGLLLYFLLRAFLSFSRGGIMGLVISFGAASLLYKKIKQDTLIKLGIGVALVSIIFFVTNNLTGGMLLLRYKGETNSTMAGTRDKTLESLSSGRSNYAEVDLAMWYDNIILGVGPGNAQFMRFQYGLYDEGAPHSEATRLLAENGIFGLFINLILILWPIYIVHRTRDREIKFIKTMLFLLAYITTYHSAMRTGLTPLFYALASMDIVSFNTLNRREGNMPISNKLALET